MFLHVACIVWYRVSVFTYTGKIIIISHYVGHDTKALLNNTGLRAKRSKLEKDINLEVIAQLVLLLLISVGGAIGERLLAFLLWLM